MAENLVVNGTAETEDLRGFNFTLACGRVQIPCLLNYNAKQ
jgi:hypothetical protein